MRQTEIRMEGLDVKIAFDIDEMKVGCVLLQATFGCPSEVASRFDTKHWLLAPTPGLKVYEINDDQLNQLITKVEARHG